MGKSKVPMWKIKELNLSIPTDTWNEVHVETRDHMQHGFYGLLESLRSWHPTVLIVQFGMSDVLIDAEPSDNFAYYRYYLEGIVSRALANDVSEIVLLSPPFHGDNAYIENREHRALEIITGITKSVARQYDVTFLDVYSRLHKFAENHNPFRYSRHVLTTDGITLNECGNKILAGSLLELFGIRMEGVTMSQLLKLTLYSAQCRFPIDPLNHMTIMVDDLHWM